MWADLLKTLEEEKFDFLQMFLSSHFFHFFLFHVKYKFAFIYLFFIFIVYFTSCTATEL